MNTFCFYMVLAISPALSATEEFCCPFEPKALYCISRPLLEIKTGYFFFSNSKLYRVYDKEGYDIQLCASYPLWSLTNRWSLDAYGAVEYFRRSGKSIHAHQKTAVWSVPVNLGLKPVYAINANMQYYFAFGPRYFYIQQHNHSKDIYKKRSRNGFGLFLNTGLNYFFSEHFMIDVFGEYSYAKMHFHNGKSNSYTRDIQVGGFTFGGGLGYQF